MRTITEHRMLNPPHPGDFIRTEIIEAHGLSVTEAAKRLQVSRSALSHLLNANADLSGEMALRIEKVFGVKMDTLLRMQASYTIARTRERESEILGQPLAKSMAAAYSRFKERNERLQRLRGVKKRLD
jgi:antitoxin HigA-1